MKLIPFKYNAGHGQTLIETLAAIFILVMGVTAAVGLAVYALSTSTEITKQIVAIGLAREGMEAVKNMRDTNWLTDTLTTPQSGGGCFDFINQDDHLGSCYKNWLGSTGNNNFYCINPSSGQGANCGGNIPSDSYYLSFDAASPASSKYWILKRDPNRYGLNFNEPTDGDSAWEDKGFYTSGGTDCASGNSGYCRRIIITRVGSASNASGPLMNQYNKNEGPMIYVQAQVWWKDKACPNGGDWPGIGKCSIELDTYLTNWRNY